MRVNSKCAHRERPPLSLIQGDRGGAELMVNISRLIGPHSVLRLGWNPRATRLTIVDKIFKPSAATN